MFYLLSAPEILRMVLYEFHSFVAIVFNLQNISLPQTPQRNPTHLSHPDYLHLTKRFGIIAASQLPLHYALALKSWSPIQYLTRRSHEQLNPYHRLLGRIIITFFSLHASMYLNFYIQKGLLLKRIRDWDVILGLTAITTALLIGTTALAKIRDWNYRVFFYVHVILSLTLLPTLYLHVSHLRIYILEAAAIYILLIIQRNVSQSPANATIKLLPRTNLLSMTIPLTKALSNKTFTPGQHIYLGFPSLPQKLRINPFSIANPSPTTDQKIHLVARKLNGTTALLADLAKSPQPTPLLIEGPYGSASHFPDLAEFDRVLFVAGGVGATFTLPLYIDLLQRAKAGGERVVEGVRFVWTVREVRDARWGIEMMREQSGGVPEPVEVHVTGAGRGDEALRAKGDEAIELQERKGLMGGTRESSDVNAAGAAKDDGDAHVMKIGRPDLRAVVDEVFASGVSDRVAVLVCGPGGMGKSLRREVGRWVGEGRDVFWHNEEFGW